MEIGVIIALVVLIGWQEYQNRKERNKLINALMAKDAKELADLEFNERIKPQPTIEKPPDLVPVDQLSDKDFEKYVEKETNG